MEVAWRRTSLRWLVVTMALGVAFLVGQVLAWRALALQGIYLPTHPHSSFIYMLTAVHGVHVLGGMIALVYAARRRQAFGVCTKYWHFVDGVWLYLLMVLGAL
jgi:cytochrome c oxidase subunit 3